MSILTTYSPAEIAVWYVAGALAWAFVMGLVGASGEAGYTLLRVAVWPVSLACSLGVWLRQLFNAI